MREKCPNTEFFFWSVFSSIWTEYRDTPYLSVFSPNAGKYRPEKTPYLDTFHAVNMCVIPYRFPKYNQKCHNSFEFMQNSLNFQDLKKQS